MCGAQVGQETSTIRSLSEAWLFRMAHEVGTLDSSHALKPQQMVYGIFIQVLFHSDWENSSVAFGLFQIELKL